MQLPRLCLVAVATIALTSPAWAADNDTLTIGFTVSQTGKLNTDSIAQMRGFDLWRDQVNAKGGIKVGDKAYNIKFVSYDDESQNGRVQQLYTRLITQDNAQFLFSPYSSGLTATAAIISEQYGKVMLTTGAAEEQDLRARQQGPVPDLFAGIASISPERCRRSSRKIRMPRSPLSTRTIPSPRPCSTPRASSPRRNT